MPNYAAQQVSTRANWADSWTPRSHMWCDEVEFATSPSMGSAVLKYRYGRGQRQGEKVETTITPLNVLGQYVRVECAGMPDWYGIITERVEDRKGHHTIGGARVETGEEVYVASSLELLLDREIISQSIIATSATAEATVNRAIAFNSGDGSGDQSGLGGNASARIGDKSTHIFAQDLTTANSVRWTAGAVIQYLLSYFGPRDEAGNVTVDFSIDVASQVHAINFLVPTIDVSGMTIKRVLDTLISRRRGVGWFLNVDAHSNTVKVEVFTFASAEVDLYSGRKLPANDLTATIDPDQDVNVQGVTLRTVNSDSFDQVVVRGARRGSVINLSVPDGSLEADWSSDQETAYETAASEQSGYDALDDDEKIARNQDARSEDKFERVFSWFAIPDDWDWLVNNGENTGSDVPAFPQLDSNGDATSTVEQSWWPGLRFSERLPFRTSHDYSGTNITDDTVSDDSPGGSASDFLRPFVLLDVRQTGYWVLSEHIAAAVDSGDSEREHDWSCNLSIRDDAPGFVLTVIGGPQHVLAENDFDALADDPDESSRDVDWQTMIAVMYVEHDSHVEERYPIDPTTRAVSAVDQGNKQFTADSSVSNVLAIGDTFTVTGSTGNDGTYTVDSVSDTVITVDETIPDATADGTINIGLAATDFVRRVWIDVPDARLDWVPAGTVTHVEFGDLQRVTTGAFVRDDRDRMRDLARAAYQWHGINRAVLSYETRGIERYIPGTLITTLGSGATQTTVNTVITSIRYDLLKFTTRITTAHAELDFA